MKNKIKIDCRYCGTEFEVWNYQKDSIYCSTKCNYDDKREEVCCDNCGISFIKAKSTIRDFNYCSSNCMHSCQERRRRISESNKKADNPSWKRYWQHVNIGKRNSPDTEFKKGSENPNWVGGTDKYRGIDWKEQRKKALERDNHVCKRCDEKGNVVHHIIPYRISKDNSLDNLITFCKACHIIHERNHSTLIIENEGYIIKNVPRKAYDFFIKLCNEEFDGKTGMTLKHLVDFYQGLVPVGTEHLEIMIEELSQRLSKIEQNIEEKKEEKPVTRKMLSGEEKIK